MADSFWTSANVEPKRQYRFLVQLSGLEEVGNLWFAKSVNKPEITVNAEEHAYLNHKFYYPGTVEWNEVSLVLVDPVSPDAASLTAKMIEQSGYRGPGQLKGATPVTNSKELSTRAVGNVIITVIDAEGNPLETWTLNNPFIIKVGYGEQSYGDDALTEIELTFRYDWATLEAGGRTYWQN
tara:strand:+ start:704 stop:1246 length:543 start_codon:yes stop_codon:yes gene_type:complete